MHESNTTRERENLRRTERRSDKSNGDEDMANLSAIFRESAKYLRERERDPRSARLSSFEVMLIKLGYIIQQMRKGGGKHARIYTQRSFARIRFIRAFTAFRLSIVRGESIFLRNFHRIEIIDDGEFSYFFFYEM